MTNKWKIMHSLKKGEKSCSEICKDIDSTKDQRSFNATISSILKKMVDSKWIKLSSNKSIKGGNIYKI